MADIAHKATDALLENMEKKVSAIYSKAHKDVEKKAADYFARFAEKDKAQKALVRGKFDG